MIVARSAKKACRPHDSVSRFSLHKCAVKREQNMSNHAQGRTGSLGGRRISTLAYAYTVLTRQSMDNCTNTHGMRDRGRRDPEPRQCLECAIKRAVKCEVNHTVEGW